MTLVLATLVSLLLPATWAQAADEPAPAVCAPLKLAPFGDPGDAVASGTLATGAQDCFTTQAKAGQHLVLLRAKYDVIVSIDGPDGPLDCYAKNSEAGSCDVPADGTYTVRVRNDNWEQSDYRLVVVPLNGTERCAPATGTSWDQPVPVRSALNGLQVDCQSLDAAPGERVVAYASTVAYGQARRWITDETGRGICPYPSDKPGCALPGDGPYRVLTYVTGESESVDYQLQVARLSDPQGCPTVTVGRYGAPPASPTGEVRCRVLTVPAAGRYLVNPVDEFNSQFWMYVYDGEATEVCRGGWCTFPSAGSYTLLVGDPTRVYEGSYGTAFLDRTGTEGCVPVAEGTHEGTLVAGQYDCLELPMPKDSRISGQPRTGTGPRIGAEVLDAVGALQCDESGLRAGDCQLSGVAPYRAIVHAEAGEQPGPYAISFLRTDSTPPGTCAVMPRSTFSDASNATELTTGGGVFTHCLAVPAADHSASELFELRTVSGTAPANFSVIDESGELKCERNSVKNGWSVCPLTPGKAHTVVFTGQDTAASYTLSRRDVTSTAWGCTKSAATAVGGPSQPGVYGGTAGALRCHKVTTAAATDRVRIDVRDSKGTLNIMALGADGRSADCSFRNRSCVVTGSTTYQVVMQVPLGLEAPDAYHRLDAWRVAEADGPAAECPRAASAAYGHAPLTGTLTEEHTAVCAVLPTVSNDMLKVTVANPSGGTDRAVVSVYDGSWTDDCMRSGDEYTCSLRSEGDSKEAPALLMVSLPEKASQVSYRVETACYSGWCGGEQFDADSVTPDSAPAGTTAELTVRGEALHESDTVAIVADGKSHPATVTGVSADWRTLTAEVDLRAVPAGTWTVSVTSHRGWQTTAGTLTVTPPQPELTGTFRPVQPTRLMDSRTGLGVPKAKIGAGKTVTLQVTGKGGVPASGVTAVVMNVTATGPTATTYISVYPDGTTRTSASNLNVRAGETRPNLVVVPVVNGKVNFFNHAGSVHLIADVSGYFAASGEGSTYEPVQPTRLMDSRTGLGVPKAKIGAGKTVVLQVTGRGGVPASGVTAVVMNVTATGPTATTYISVYPNGTTRTSASNLNVVAGQTAPNLVVVPVVNGKVNFFNYAGSVNLIADVQGYFTSSVEGSTYRPLTPTRFMDTRTGLGVPKAKVAAGKTVTLQVTGKNGVPASGVTAVVMNVTATGPTATTYISVYPNGTTRTSASNLNVVAGQTAPNLVVVPVVNGRVSFYNHAGSVNLIADVAGYYVK
ncbi:Tat pathway signal protein [Streptomyces peucetius]|uniref:Tat pathway signal protein n=1 Tax=Streptomyces peucetius TaxID=1950 RepID=A0ABY6I771_STRPE|nr:Tat pathway signal protein [Streptomyces peucetius]UYQ62849.1 Tat pathway signal protein [Streptomyces peucetius]